MPETNVPTATNPPHRKVGWLRAGATAPLIRQRRPLVRLVLALTSSTALIGVAALVVAAAIVPPIGARRVARASAQREVQSQLASGERIVASVFASQRRWTDMWRESFGIVVATDRRVLYVGAPPTPLLRPREDGPEELLVESYPYTAAFTLEPRTLFRGLGRGLALRTPGVQVDFRGRRHVVRRTPRHAIDRLGARRGNTPRRGFDASNQAPAPPAAEYVTHIVRRGETLTALARRYRTSPDVLRQLNQLSTDDIRSGQRLRVPRVDEMP